MKPKFYRLLLLVFLTSIFYDESQSFLVKKLIFSVFLYLSLWEFFIIYRDLKSGQLLPAGFKAYFKFYTLFVAINCLSCFFTSSFNFVTLINNPAALLAAIPVFAFAVGFYSSKEDIVKLLNIVCIVFPFMFFPHSFGSLPYYPGYVCSVAIIPAFIFSLDSKKNTTLFVLLIFLQCVFSYISEYRTIILKVIYFIGLFGSLSLFKRYKYVKIAVLAVVFFLTFQIVSDFENSLNFFEKVSNSKVVDGTDTRSFLFVELFGSFKANEFIWGRGFLGTYLSEYFLKLQKGAEYADSFNRFTVEVGFLELILKGGFIYVFFYFFPLVFTSIKGLLSKGVSDLSFNLSIYILVEVLIMFFENIPSYTLNFFLLFFIAGFVYRDLFIYENISNNGVIQPG